MAPLRLLLLLLLASAAIAAAAPASAAAAGGPIVATAVPDGTGIESLDGQYRYATVSAGGTAAVRIVRGSGEIDSTSYVRGSDGVLFGIPQVATDGSASGLSADGGTLVLIRAFGPVNRAEMVVLGTNRLRVKNRIELEGQYSFDAISPDGRFAYVVEYPRPFVYDRYRVLRLDLKSGRLAKRPISDEDVGLEETDAGGGSDGEMRGLALSRVESPDGRWAYTLYDGGGDVPFIHALDTVGDRAVCIFLPQIEDLGWRQLAKATITSGPDEGTISVVGRTGSELARIDTTDFAVTTPGDAVSKSGPGPPIPLLVGLAVAALGLAAVAVLRRRRHDAGGGAP